MKVSTPAKVSDVIESLFPQAFDGERPTWPPDAFAIAASILKQSGAYTQLVNRWPPQPPFDDVKAWARKIGSLKKQWRNKWEAYDSWPVAVNRWWRDVLTHKGTALDQVFKNPELLTALVGIVAAADETCFNFGSLSCARDLMDYYAAINLEVSGSLCFQVDASRAIVLPKLHNPYTGMTLRSLTHNLALWHSAEVTPVWKQISPPKSQATMNLLLVPWPLKLQARSFRKADIPEISLAQGYDFFTYDDGRSPADVDRIAMLVEQAENLVGPIYALVFPELSLTRSDFVKVLRSQENRLVIAGIGKPARAGRYGENYVAIGIGRGKAKPWLSEQQKHHRWLVDERQIGQYALSGSMDNSKKWWEAIRLPRRECIFYNANEWFTFCALICEDLARQDPVADLVRCVGPNLVVALLMDGPQIEERWSARYATVLAEDPRSSVLTLTCAGLVDIACWQYGGGPRSIALWKDATNQTRRILLEPDAEAVALTIVHKPEREWSADGREDGRHTEYLRLVGVHQVKPQ
ncbi:MAG: hypothetical protein ABR949_05760 [Candidatus Aquilonibacter sp.]